VPIVALLQEGLFLGERTRSGSSDGIAPLPDGRLALPSQRYPLATVWWEAGALREG